VSAAPLPGAGDPATIRTVKEVAELLNGMCVAGVIKDYALFGAAAQMRYTEAVATLDADVLVATATPGGLDPLAAIHAYGRDRGYAAEGEAMRVGAWPVQFIPVFSPLTEEAVDCAETADFEGVPFRVVGAVYLAVIALSVGRAKDFARVLGLMESGAATHADIGALAARHGLSDAWNRFVGRFLDDRA